MLARVLLHVPTRVFLHVLPREEHMCYIAKSNMCSMLALGMAMWLGEYIPYRVGRVENSKNEN